MNTITVQLNDKQYDFLDNLLGRLTQGAEKTPSNNYEMLVSLWRDINTTKTYLWSSGCGRVELEIDASHVEAIAVSGDNEAACREAIENDGYLRRQLEELNMDLEVAVNFLTEAGIENAAEKDNDELRLYILWMACHDIAEERNQED